MLTEALHMALGLYKLDYYYKHYYLRHQLDTQQSRCPYVKNSTGPSQRAYIITIYRVLCELESARASKGTRGDAKCITEILWDKYSLRKLWEGGKIYLLF